MGSQPQGPSTSGGRLRGLSSLCRVGLGWCSKPWLDSGRVSGYLSLGGAGVAPPRAPSGTSTDSPTGYGVLSLSDLPESTQSATPGAMAEGGCTQ